MTASACEPTGPQLYRCVIGTRVNGEHSSRSNDPMAQSENGTAAMSSAGQIPLSLRSDDQSASAAPPDAANPPMTMAFGGVIPAVVNIPVAPYAAIAPPTPVNARRNRAYPSFATLIL